MTYQNSSPKRQKSRKDLMATMAQMSNYLPAVNFDSQEEAARFMVQQLRGNNVQTQPYNPQERPDA